MMGGCSVSKMGRLGAQCAIAWCLLSLTLVHARWLLRVNETFVVTQDVRQPVVLQGELLQQLFQAAMLWHSLCGFVHQIYYPI